MKDISVKLQLSTKEGNLKAFGTVTIAPFQVNCRVMNGSKGLFVGLPSRKDGEKWQDEVRFTSREEQEEVSRVVLENYNSLVSGASTPGNTKAKSATNSSSLPF